MFPKISGKISIGVLYPLLKGQNTPYLTGDTGRGGGLPEDIGRGSRG